MSLEPPPLPQPLLQPGAGKRVAVALAFVLGLALLILPGGCGIRGLVSMLSDYMQRGRMPHLGELVIIFSSMGVLLGIGGIFLIRWALRRRRAIIWEGR